MWLSPQVQAPFSNDHGSISVFCMHHAPRIGSMLLDVDDEDLQEFGVGQRFERKRLLLALRDLQRQGASKDAS